MGNSSSACRTEAACQSPEARGLNKQPNPPTWPSTVQVFGPSTSASIISSAVWEAFSVNGGDGNHGQWSSNRYAFLFEPGTYDVDVPVGYYTQVLGLGTTPSEVKFTSGRGVYCEEGNSQPNYGALSTFWRGAENFQTDAGSMLWAVSQATALRRIVATNDISLSQNGGYSSGGFIGNSQVAKTVYAGSQQQFAARNCKVGWWSNGVWNTVFVGVEGAPTDSSAYTQVSEAPVIAEKPFISIDSGSGKYSLNVPAIKNDRVGTDYSTGTQIDFEMVYVASADKDTSATINAALANGLHVVLSAGIYNLDSALEIVHPNQVLLGIGIPTLVTTKGDACVKVRDVSGVRVAGMLLQAGSVKSETLLQWGTRASRASIGVLSDVYARVGGPADASQAQSTLMLEINMDKVILDNTWLWRADHTANGETYNGDLPCQVGAIINGDDFTAYGFKVEHCLTDQVQWNGDRGRTYMFQSELPYDVTGEYGTNGYCGYRVADNVQQHLGYGIGVYHFFRDHVVTCKSGICVPSHVEQGFQNAITVYLNGKGTIENVINSQGAATGPGRQMLSRTSTSAPTGVFTTWEAASTPEDTRMTGQSVVEKLSLPTATAEKPVKPLSLPTLLSCNDNAFNQCGGQHCSSKFLQCSSPVAGYSPILVGASPVVQQEQQPITA